MEFFKLQIGCMLIVLYIAFVYYHERKHYKVKNEEPMFEVLLYTGIFSIFFDGLTAYTVNHLDRVPSILNTVFHACFLLSIVTVVFVIFIYIYNITKGLKHNKKAILFVPYILAMAVIIFFMPQLEYRHGDITNYSMGISAYVCFIMVGIYMFGSITQLVIGRKNLTNNKLIVISTGIIAAIVVTLYQMFNPQALLTCLVPTFFIISTYLNLENPLFLKLQAHNQDMVMGFATLVEKRDNSTGGHIRRTTTYVEMLARELKQKKMYEDILTEDYIKNLVMAAPMHDIGKIAIPDAILQKPDRLTPEEFSIMKTHSEKGGNIIKETFNTMDNEQYKLIAYQVARYHHEKWDGTGYPEGLTGDKIPLCARIMSVVDVFDAVSAKRCYKPALPLNKCFDIIEEGIGRNFDPFIAEVFLNMKTEISQMVEHNS